MLQKANHLWPELASSHATEPTVIQYIHISAINKMSDEIASCSILLLHYVNNYEK